MEQESAMPVQAMAAILATANSLAERIATTTSGLDAVEGQRFLLRMLSASCDTFVEHHDVDRPTFVHAESTTRKMFADNPDSDYLRAPISLQPGRVYRLWGRIPDDALYVGILLYGKGGRIGNRLTDRQLQLDRDGRFEILIATTEQPGVWLAGQGDETAVLVRQYFSDRSVQEPLTVDIQLVGDPGPLRPLDAADFTERLARSERMLQAIFKRTYQAHQMATSIPANHFQVLPADQFFPTPDNHYAVARYQLREGERAVVRGRLPTARYFSLALYNTWLESFDYQHQQVALNHEQIKLQGDGSFEILLGDYETDHHNRLATAGHAEGYLIARALLLEGEMPELTIEIVPV